jgi:hypothetical protein
MRHARQGRCLCAERRAARQAGDEGRETGGPGFTQYVVVLSLALCRLCGVLTGSQAQQSTAQRPPKSSRTITRGDPIHLSTSTCQSSGRVSPSTHRISSSTLIPLLAVSGLPGPPWPSPSPSASAGSASDGPCIPPPSPRTPEPASQSGGRRGGGAGAEASLRSSTSAGEADIGRIQSSDGSAPPEGGGLAVGGVVAASPTPPQGAGSGLSGAPGALAGAAARYASFIRRTDSSRCSCARVPLPMPPRGGRPAVRASAAACGLGARGAQPQYFWNVSTVLMAAPPCRSVICNTRMAL